MLDLGHWLSDLISRRAADYLTELGVEPAYIGVAAAIIGVLALKLLWTLMSEDHVEPNWAAINPDDEMAVQKAYNDLNTVVRLGKLLNEDAAATIEDFQSQLRRAGLWRGSIAPGSPAPARQGEAPAHRP